MTHSRRTPPLCFCFTNHVVSITALAFGLHLVASAQAQLTNSGQFSAGAGTLVGAGFDPADDRVWVYGDFDSLLRSYSRTGVAGPTLARPGGSANDADIEFAPEDFTLGSTLVPAGSLLFVNGESGVAEVYAVNKVTGALISSLTTAFGADHVVGLAYHSGRNTLFLVSDKVDPITPTLAEIDTRSGAVLQTFGTGSSDYTVNYGDVEISLMTGNLYLVSSDESRIRVLTPAGEFVQDLALPAGVSSISGIALDDARGEALLSGTGGMVWRVGGFPMTSDAPVMSIRLSQVEQVEVSWTSRSNATYQLQYRSTLTTNGWAPLLDCIRATNSVTYFYDTLLAGPQKYYRAVLTTCVPTR